jgi:hypothetical protein
MEPEEEKNGRAAGDAKSIDGDGCRDQAKDSALSNTMAMESTMDKSARKKKFKGFPMFFTFENFKKGLFERHEAMVEPSLALPSSLSLSSSL